MSRIGYYSPHAPHLYPQIFVGNYPTHLMNKNQSIVEFFYKFSVCQDLIVIPSLVIQISN